MRKNLLDRIAVKLVLWLVTGSAVFTLLGTSLQLYFDYQRTVDRFIETNNEIVSNHLPEMVDSLLSNKSFTIFHTLHHLLEDGSVSYVAVVVKDEIVWRLGDKISSKSKSLSYPLSGNSKLSSPLGILEIEVDLRPIQSEMIHRFGGSLIQNGLAIFLTAAFVFFMFQLLVTNHLEKLAEQVRKFDPAKPFSPLKLHRKKMNSNDELQQVVDSVNAMQEKVQTAYETLTQNEERLLLFFDSTEEAIIGVDRTGICSFANDSCLALLDIITYEDIIGKNIDQLFRHSTHVDSLMELEGKSVISKSMEQAGVIQCEDGLILTPDGRKTYVTLRSYPVFQLGVVTGALVFLSDTSQTRQLRRESELLSEAVKQIPVMIAITDTENKIQYVNSGAESLLGFSLDDMVGKTLHQFYEEFGGDADKYYSEIEKHLEEGRPWKGIVEIQSPQKNGLKFYTMFFPVYDETGRVVNTISVSREVTHEFKLQNELVNTKKMEAVGRLSASLAHEFGNPLLGISAVLKDIKEREVLSKEDGGLLSLAYSECERMRGMLREFQQLQKESYPGLKHESIAKLMMRVVTDIDPLMRANGIVHSLNIVDEAREIVVSRSKLEMVVSNIILNGVESMRSRGGQLEISTGFDETFFKISIKDSGVGIKTEHQEFIFEPFFSTKPEIEGAGLGLSVAYGTMKSLGGSIAFSSEEGKGALFHILIPLK